MFLRFAVQAINHDIVNRANSLTRSERETCSAIPLYKAASSSSPLMKIETELVSLLDEFSSENISSECGDEELDE